MKRKARRASLAQHIAVVTAFLVGAISRGAEPPKEQATFGGHTAVVSSVAVTSDGKLLITAGYDKSVKLWDLTTGKELASLPGRGPVAISPDDKAFASGGEGDVVKLWDVGTRREIASIKHDYHVKCIAFTSDSKSLITAGEGPIKLFDAATGKEQSTLRLAMTKNNGNLVLGMSMTGNGKTLCTGHADGTIRLWDLATGKDRDFLTVRGKAPNGEVASVAFTWDGKALATGFGDGTVKLWDVATGKERLSMKAHTVRAWTVAFSPDDKMVASGGWDGLVKLWDVESGRERASFTAHDDRVYVVQFTKDGKLLISGGGVQFKRGEAKIWSIAEVLKFGVGK